MLGIIIVSLLDEAEGRIDLLCQSHPHTYVYREYIMYVAGVVYVVHIEEAGCRITIHCVTFITRLAKKSSYFLLLSHPAMHDAVFTSTKFANILACRSRA